MEVAGMALIVVGYALFYTGASNLFTSGNGWGFLQSLLNKGESNNSNSFGSSLFGGSSDSGVFMGTVPTNGGGSALGNPLKG